MMNLGRINFWHVVVLTAVACVTLASVGEAVYVTWWKTPAGDTMVNETTDALNVHIVGDNTGTSAVVDDGDVPSSGTVGEVVGIQYGGALAHGSNPTAVADGGRVVLKSNRAGIQFVIGGHPNIITREYTWTDADNAQTDDAIVTVGAGSKIVVTAAMVTCDNANTTDVAVRVGFGSSTLPALSSKLATGIILKHAGIAAGSGMNRGHGEGIVGIGGDNEDLRITAEDPLSGSCSLTVSYYTIES